MQTQVGLCIHSIITRPELQAFSENKFQNSLAGKVLNTDGREMVGNLTEVPPRRSRRTRRENFNAKAQGRKGATGITENTEKLQRRGAKTQGGRREPGKTPPRRSPPASPGGRRRTRRGNFNAKAQGRKGDRGEDGKTPPRRSPPASPGGRRRTRRNFNAEARRRKGDEGKRAGIRGWAGSGKN